MPIPTSTSALQIEVAQRDSAVVVKLIGSADIHSADVLDRQMTLLSARHPRLVVFDLEQLTFISSISMGSLVRFHNAAPHWGGTAVFACTQTSAWEAIARARLDLLFQCHPSVDDALAAAQGK